MVPGMLLCRLPSQLQLLHNIIPVIEKKNTAKKKVYTTTDTTQWFCGKLLNLLPVFM